MSDEEEDDLGIKPGTVIDSSKANYVVIKLLGEGGFGAVFKVHDQKDPTKLFAMKVEKKLETRKHSKLKMENTTQNSHSVRDLVYQAMFNQTSAMKRTKRYRQIVEQNAQIKRNSLIVNRR
ncbi:hypothetical protein V3C99_000906 [Haemonchus contortus]